jgi:hypothetical protein
MSEPVPALPVEYAELVAALQSERPSNMLRVLDLHLQAATAITALSARIEALEVGTLQFQAGIPDIAAGSMRCFIALMVSRHSGKDCILPLYYLNGYPLEYEECQCGDNADAHDDGCPTTGWFYDESNFDYENCYHPIAGEVVAWAELPSPETARSLLPEVPHG